MNTYKITYNHGLHEDITVNAESEDMAKREAVAAYRKDSGAVNILSFRPVEFVVKSVNKIN